MESIVGGVGWDVPIRVLAALHYLQLTDGIDPWHSLPAVLGEHRAELARFVTEQHVQTNEVGRCVALLPAFLELARASGRRLDLLELGPSAGLNLVFDGYRYRYRNGSWGPADAPVLLEADERTPVPADLLGGELEVVRRRGIDRNPVDVTTDEGVRLLSSFVWADQPQRLARLEQAIAVVRADPPDLVRGDYVALVPELLADRDPDVLTAVFQTASTQYLSAEQYETLRRTLVDASLEAPLGWVSTRRHDEDDLRFDGYGLELALWPEQERRVIARMGYHGEWLDWQ